jgi:hypothetical protein
MKPLALLHHDLDCLVNIMYYDKQSLPQDLERLALYLYDAI